MEKRKMCLKPQPLDIDPYDLEVYIPDIYGNYFLRTVIEDSTQPDPVPSTNQVSLRLSTFLIKDLYVPIVKRSDQ